MKKLYEFYWGCGRQGDVQGLFIADDGDVADAIGEEIYFGEILGKHSEIYGTLGIGDLTIKSDDQEFISKLESFLGETVSGYNPLINLAGTNDYDLAN